MRFSESLAGPMEETALNAVRIKRPAFTGKLADLVVLEKNPLKVDPASIKNIQVVETIKEGTTVYKLGAAKS
jgi:hypothetical protein